MVAFDKCRLEGAAERDISWKTAVLQLLCQITEAIAPSDNLPFFFTSGSPSTKATLIAAAPAGYKNVITYLSASAGSAAATFTLYKTTATGPVHTAISPQFDLAISEERVFAQSGMFQGGDAQSITVDASLPIDFVGTYKVVPV